VAGQVEFEKNYVYLGQKNCIRNIGSLLNKSTINKMVAEFEFGSGASRLYQGPCDLSLQIFEHSHEFANLQWR